MKKLKLNNLEIQPGVKKSKKLGRGRGSGVGKTSSRGMKGQKCRFKVRAGFEGGQTPIIKRIPKRGANMNLDKGNLIQAISSDKLLSFLTSNTNVAKNNTVCRKFLQEKGFIKNKNNTTLKILLGNSIKDFMLYAVENNITFSFDKYSKSMYKLLQDKKLISN